MTDIKMTSVNFKSLKEFVFNSFMAMGLNKIDAEIFSDALMFSELRFQSGQGQGVQNIFLLEPNLFKTNYEVSLRQPHPYLNHGVYLKHPNMILRCSNILRIFDQNVQ